MKLMFDVTNQSLKPGSQDHLGSTHLDLSAVSDMMLYVDWTCVLT